LQLTINSKRPCGRIKTARDIVWLNALDETTDRIIIFFVKVLRNKHVPGEKETLAKEWP